MVRTNTPAVKGTIAKKALKAVVSRRPKGERGRAAPDATPRRSRRRRGGVRVARRPEEKGRAAPRFSGRRRRGRTRPSRAAAGDRLVALRERDATRQPEGPSGRGRGRSDGAGALSAASTNITVNAAFLSDADASRTLLARRPKLERVWRARTRWPPAWWRAPERTQLPRAGSRPPPPRGKRPRPPSPRDGARAHPGARARDGRRVRPLSAARSQRCREVGGTSARAAPGTTRSRTSVAQRCSSCGRRLSARIILQTAACRRAGRRSRVAAYIAPGKDVEGANGPPGAAHAGCRRRPRNPPPGDGRSTTRRRAVRTCGRVGRSLVVRHAVAMIMIARNGHRTICNSRKGTGATVTARRRVLVRRARPTRMIGRSIRAGAVVTTWHHVRTNGMMVGDVDTDGVTVRRGRSRPCRAAWALDHRAAAAQHGSAAG